MRSVESAVAVTLVVGALLGIGLMAAGLAGYEVQNHAAFQTRHGPEGVQRPSGSPGSLHAIALGLQHLPPDPLAVTALGSLLLLLTPVAGVGTAAVAFARARDRRYAAIAAAVLLAIGLSFLLGAAG